MKKTISAKCKILILVIPLLLSCFFIISTVVIRHSLRYQINMTTDFMQYRFEHSASFASTVINRDDEYIWAYNAEHELIFQSGGLSPEWSRLYPVQYHRSALNIYTVSGREYIGMSRHIPEAGRELFLVEDKDVFDMPIQQLKRKLASIFAVSFLAIAAGLCLLLNRIINPVNTVRTSIRKTPTEQEFPHTTFAGSSAGIGELLNPEIENLELLGRVSDYKDSTNGAHVCRVSSYSRVIAATAGFDKEYLDLVYHSALLHDIGKLGIPDSILLKRGRLTDEEFGIMKTHTSIGHTILSNFSGRYLKAGAIIAYSHHEKYDGSGYPQGLSGENIPQFGRIVSIADVFDALTTERSYKEAWPVDDAFAFIENERGRQFDPFLADIFLKQKTEIIAIYHEMMETVQA